MHCIQKVFKFVFIHNMLVIVHKSNQLYLFLSNYYQANRLQKEPRSSLDIKEETKYNSLRFYVFLHQD